MLHRPPLTCNTQDGGSGGLHTAINACVVCQYRARDLDQARIIGPCQHTFNSANNVFDNTAITIAAEYRLSPSNCPFKGDVLETSGVGRTGNAGRNPLHSTGGVERLCRKESCYIFMGKEVRRGGKLKGVKHVP